MRKHTTSFYFSEITKGACIGIVVSVFVYTVAWVFAGFACHFSSVCSF